MRLLIIYQGLYMRALCQIGLVYNNRWMRFHCLLQIIGMTASLGVGDAMVCGSAVQYILRKCANLDARGITITRKNKEELRQIVHEPQEGRKPLLHRLMLEICWLASIVIIFQRWCPSLLRRTILFPRR